MFCMYVVRYGGNQPQVAVECLSVPNVTEELNFVLFLKIRKIGIYLTDI